MICHHVRIDYLCYFYDFPKECWLRIGHNDCAESKKPTNILPLIKRCLFLKVYCASLEKDSKTSKKYAACPNRTLSLWKSPTPAFSSQCQWWYNYVFILVSQTVWFLSWMLEDFGRFFFLILMFSEHHCLVLCYNSNWTTNGPVLTHVKDRNTWFQSVPSAWVLCWISDFIFIKWYYISIIPFFSK